MVVSHGAHEIIGGSHEMQLHSILELDVGSHSLMLSWQCSAPALYQGLSSITGCIIVNSIPTVTKHLHFESVTMV